MKRQVLAFLAPVRRRQQLLFCIRSAAFGLLLSAIAGTAAGIWQWWTGLEISHALAVGLLVTGPILGMVVGIVIRIGWAVAAHAIDRHYELKDRAITALEFASRIEPSVLHLLQLEEATEHLKRVSASEVVPLRLPRTLAYAVGVLVCASALLFWPMTSQPVQASIPATPPQILLVHEQLTEDLAQLDEIANEEESEELKELVQELKKMADELQEPGVDVREALATLSEMQTAVQALQAQFNQGLVDGQLAALGEALALSPAFEGAGKALQDADLDKAAEKIEQLEPMDLPRKEAKVLQEKLEKVAKAMQASGLGQLSDAVGDMVDGIGDGHNGKFKQGTKKLGKEVRNQARRRRVNDFLLAQLARFSEQKCDCQRNNLARFKRPVKSLNPSETFGLFTSGNVQGTKTQLLSQRNIEEITGQPGEGPSEVETTHSPEGRQQAGRTYREVYKKYRSLSEDVLDKEPIPLGHRQMIRRYFELIRPQQGEDDISN